MNDRIRELAIQAGAEYYAQTVLVNGTDADDLMRKFADLIVNECIGVIDVGGEFVSRPKMVERVRSHFSIEQ